jgi:hypothetical protein
MAVSLPTYSGTGFEFADKTPGDVISKALPYTFVFAGLGLLLMLIWGGITLMTAAGDANKAKAGYGRITGALIGFLIVFISYFILQILQTVLGLQII